MDRNEHRLEPRHLGVPSGASKMISEPMACLTQSEHISCSDANSVFKWNETRFRMTHVTEEFHQVNLKRFPSLWYVRRKPCTYLASTLAYLQIDRIELPLDPHPLDVSLGVCKTIFETMVRLVQTVHLSCTDTNTISKWTEIRFHKTHVT
jgi:hypothetical protein